MEKYLELCVELKESHVAKDGLHQYKNICQNVNVKSLEDVILQYLKLAEEQVTKAKKNSSDTVVVDVDDLDVLNSPESLLLKAVSGESSQDRTDRDVLAPWLKFVWESYKQCLDLVKNNNKLEQIYQQVAKRAFEFCVRNSRKTEFRKLCETIRQHMVQCQKYHQQPTSIDLTKPETQNLHLETRLIQLNHAISMELWQEAYKAAEDIYSLMGLSKTKPKPGQMLNYYSKLSLIFWKAGNHLFHAATLQKLFVLLKEQKKNISQEELTKISTRVLLATLSVPIPLNRTPIDESLETDETTMEKLKRLGLLLGVQTAPTRSSLLKDLVKYNVVQYVYPEVKDLYEWLEVEFHPLKMSTRVNSCLEYLEKHNDMEFSQYITALKDIAVMRLLKQVSQVYTTIEIARFVKLAPFMDKFHLEKVIVDAAKNNGLQIRINHQTKSLSFGNDLYVAQREDTPEGPHIQSMPSEQIRTQLMSMNQVLHKACDIISKDDIRVKHVELSAHIAGLCRQTCERQHADLLKRKNLIEAQKELYERLALEREAREQTTREEEERKKRDEEERKRRALIEETKRNTELNALKDMGRKVGMDIPGFEDKEEQEQKLKQIERLKREKKELDEKLKKEEKRVDHFVRASHENELPLLLKSADEDARMRREYWEKKECERVELLLKERQIQAENRDRLLRMVNDKDAFLDILSRARNDDYQKKMKEFKDKLEAAREVRMAERKEQRKLERKTKYYKDLEEKKKRDEDERRAREDDERRRKLDEQAEKQRAKEREIDEKYRLAADKDRDANGSANTAEVKPYRPPRQRMEQPQQQYQPPQQREPPVRPQVADEDSSWRRPRQTDENIPPTRGMADKPPMRRDDRDDRDFERPKRDDKP
jgi:translation initiation factor 3 subunit A